MQTRSLPTRSSTTLGGASPQLDASPTLVPDELELLAALAPLAGARVIELGCGAAGMVRKLVQRFPDARVVALEIDPVQHRKNVAKPAGGIRFVEAGAQSIPEADASFDLALMLKSLHHVPLDAMDSAFGEVWRVLRPGGLLYVSEPVFAGALNEVQRVYNDEEVVRGQAIAAIARALSSGRWRGRERREFLVPVRFADFAAFAARSIDVSFADRRLSPAQLTEVRRRFERHLGPDGAAFEAPMRVDLLERIDR